METGTFSAAPQKRKHYCDAGETIPGDRMYSILGLIVLVLDIIALVKLWGGSSDMGHKVLWTILILILPFVGMILYFLIGEKSSDANV
jgi:hypothetical protein